MNARIDVQFENYKVNANGCISSSIITIKMISLQKECNIISIWVTRTK